MAVEIEVAAIRARSEDRAAIIGGSRHEEGSEDEAESKARRSN
jgi:hypothetical protein